MNTNRATRLAKQQNYTYDRTTSVYGHVLLHNTELDGDFNNEVYQAIESWIKNKIDDSTTLKRKFEKVIKAKAKKEALIKNIAKALDMNSVLA